MSDWMYFILGTVIVIPCVIWMAVDTIRRVDAHRNQLHDLLDKPD